MRNFNKIFLVIFLMIFTNSISFAQTDRNFSGLKGKIEILNDNKDLTLKQKLKLFIVLKNKQKKLKEEKAKKINFKNNLILKPLLNQEKKEEKIKKPKKEKEVKNIKNNKKIVKKIVDLNLPKLIRVGSNFYDKPFYV